MKYKGILESDSVLPLRYYEDRDVYHVPFFSTEGRLSWYRAHCDDDYYIRCLDVGIFEIGSFRGKKLPNLKKVTVECPDSQSHFLQPVTGSIMFCPQCAPHKYVRNGEILKKQWNLSPSGTPQFFIPGEENE